MKDLIILNKIALYFRLQYRIRRFGKSSKISADPGLLKIRHAHRFVAEVIHFYNCICSTGLNFVERSKHVAVLVV